MLPTKRMPCPVVCACLQVTRPEVMAEIRKGRARSLADLKERLGAGDGCTACHPDLCALLEREVRKQA
jgi:bacterioferritin-associated ferredoxin